MGLCRQRADIGRYYEVFDADISSSSILNNENYNYYEPEVQLNYFIQSFLKNISNLNIYNYFLLLSDRGLIYIKENKL